MRGGEVCLCLLDLRILREELGEELHDEDPSDGGKVEKVGCRAGQSSEGNDRGHQDDERHTADTGEGTADDADPKRTFRLRDDPLFL